MKSDRTNEVRCYCGGRGGVMPFIVIDFDETYTAFPVLFDGMFRTAIADGVTVIICTARQEGSGNADIESVASHHGIPVVYAGWDSKWRAIEKAGYIPENAIWIEDTPRAIEGLRFD